MRRRKKGYPALLGLTVVLTLCGVLVAALPAGAVPVLDAGGYARMAAALGFMAAAGVTCAVRKRFFTEE
ncbi:MAG: hypothetical protein GF331_08220, partial [Chitinivibrionales bacterium]|nr:hypothetical protein [Chitinivibrionales bacterium]